FCTVAGWLADRYSKRQSLVFWKFAEVGITLVALGGFAFGTAWRGHAPFANFGPYLVLSTVFLMGMHSAFFVPAKYGVMPEILQPHLLSKGNGLLESLSFLAVILGTVSGGILSWQFREREYVIGFILAALAVVGAGASLLIRKMPAANPDRPFPPYVFQPLYQNLRTLFRSRPLALAVVGIAFFTFVVAFMRATVYMHGETRIPRWTELQTSIVVGFVALGIGLGSPLAGFFSGGRVELGLVPLGAAGMIVSACLAAWGLDRLSLLLAAITCIGFFTGFYIVPLFTLLQYRAPKTSKGDAVATSNFINVVGAIAASVLFFVVVFVARFTGLAPEVEQDPEWAVGKLVRLDFDAHGHAVYFEVDQPGNKKDVARGKPNEPRAGTEAPEGLPDLSWEESESSALPVIRARRDVEPQVRVKPNGEVVRNDEPSEVAVSHYKIKDVDHYRIRLAGTPARPVHDRRELPQGLFLGAGLMTLATLFLLCRQLPDLFLRTLWWRHALARYRLRVLGIANLPGNGPVVLATNCDTVEGCLQVATSADRYSHLVLPEPPAEAPLGPVLRYLARKSSLALLPAGAKATDTVVGRAVEVLGRGGVVALPRCDNGGGEELLAGLQRGAGAVIVPVHFKNTGRRGGPPFHRLRVEVRFGKPLPPETPPEEVRLAIARLAEDGETLSEKPLAPASGERGEAGGSPRPRGGGEGRKTI
ncbi:MAG TPA: MFS transporter, partial [Gemmataceae bacterium]|nr:MFS transporter [Gemmataceae bacterium]